MNLKGHHVNQSKRGLMLENEFEKLKLFCSCTQKPEPLKCGWFHWIKTIVKTKDDVLLQYTNFDAFTFIYYLRTLRKLTMILTLICITILLPVNIAATYNTG